MMDTLAFLSHGIAVALEPTNLLFALIGVSLGTLVGVLPGISPSLTVALLLPVTFKLDPAGSLIMFAGVYYGGQYGGSTAAILLNTPGESSAIATAIEGHKMAKAGRAGAALATAAVGSFVAGTIATLGLALAAPHVVRFALAFGPAETFALMVLAFVTISTAFGTSALLGLASLSIGLTLGVVGIDFQSGQARLAFGTMELLDGIEVTTAAIGVLAVAELLYMAMLRQRDFQVTTVPRGSVWMTTLDWSRSWKPWLRGTALGFPMGALPAGGGEIPTFLSYALEKRLSRYRSQFGKGAIEGVAGPEAANNAAAAGALIPLLTLGLPTSATAAMMLAGFQQYGLQPGPLLFTSNPTLVWGLIGSLFVGNLALLILNLPMIGLWIRLLSVPTAWLNAAILTVATMGTLAVNPSPSELLMLLGLGVIGLGLRIAGMPTAPLIIGLIIGPMSEQQLRRALTISQGDMGILVQSPISFTLLMASALVILTVAGLALAQWLSRGGGAVAAASGADSAESNPHEHPINPSARS